MAQFRLWLWWLGFALCAYAALFFLWFAVAPFDTVGDPAFDIPHIRVQAWQDWPLRGWAVAYAQLLASVVWLLVALTAGQLRRAAKAALVIALLFMGLFAMTNEYPALIQYGDLRDPYPIAEHKLMVSRAITAALALAALWAGWWARPASGASR